MKLTSIDWAAIAMLVGLISFACGAPETEPDPGGTEAAADTERESEAVQELEVRLTELETRIGTLRSLAGDSPENIFAELDRLDDEMDELRARLEAAEPGDVAWDEIREDLEEVEAAYEDLQYEINPRS